jgi:hypothetical protein
MRLHGMRLPTIRFLALGALALLAACTPPQPPKPPADSHVPDFAKKPYEPISRENVVAIALREWRLFGQPVNDDPPGTPRPDTAKPERDPGLWQRVGEYWWIGMDAGRDESGWTGKHDTFGTVFPPDMDGEYAWSAAFISYVMRISGAGKRFAYAPSHWTYIDRSVRDPGGLFVAERPETAVPQPGDVICTGRGRSRALRFDDLPAGPYLSHCDIVVAAMAGQLSVIGGNVDDAVTMKHVPLTPDGHLASPDGRVVDTRYAWMVVLRLND